MPELGKTYPVSGSGSPLAARETLLASMLFQCGYKFYSNAAQGDTANFQDLTDPQTRARLFIYNFDASISARFQPGDVVLPVKLAADAIKTLDLTAHKSLQWRARIYAEYTPGKSPLKALNQHAALVPAEERDQFQSLLEWHEELLKTVATMPRHTVVRRGGRTYHVKMGEDIEAQIASLG